MGRAIAAALLASGVAALACWRRTLTLGGAMAATVVGAVVFLRGGLPAAGSLLAFFVSASALSRIGQARKASGSLAQAKGARRDAWQVLANGGWATVCIGLGQRHAFVGALAAAGADTWATEVGMLASRQPRLVTNLRPVPTGSSGGITPEGLAASLGGALVVGLAWLLLGGDRRGMPVAAVAGACGSLVDSWLGATAQALYRCRRCGMSTEEARHRKCGQPTELVRGQAWITNDAVNAISTLTGAAIGGLMPQKARRGGTRQGRG